MAAAVARPSTRSGLDRTPKSKQNRTEIWTSLLQQTRVAQARNRSNAVAHRQIVVCDGSPEDQKTFLDSLKRPPPPQAARRNRVDADDAREKGSLNLSNQHAYGYGHVSLFSAQSGTIGAAALGRESEEVAQLDCHCVPAPEVAYEVVLRKLLAEKQSSNDDDDDRFGQEEDQQQADPSADAPKRPTVAILLSWKQPWKFLRQLRAWLQLLARALLPASSTADEEPIDVVKEHGLSIVLVIQHVEAQQAMEREGWTEETFDYVCQILRTAILPVHPFSALIYMPSIPLPSQPSSPLSEAQKVVYTAMNLDLTTLSPRTNSATGEASTGMPLRKEDLLPRHNVVDRMNIVIPGGWDSAGKVRLLSETFSPEEVLSAWTNDLSDSIFPSRIPRPIEVSTPVQSTPGAEQDTRRQAEEVFAAEPRSAVSSMPGSPAEPEKTAPSAISAFEAQVVDPDAHKAPKAPTITVVTRQEQDFLREMKVELDSYAAKDRERAATSGTSTPNSASRMIGVPAGESTGALDGLGEVSFNVGGVNYNNISAEAAIERLRRPQPTDSPLPQGSAQSGASGSRAGTPRQPRRLDRDHESTPGVTSPTSTKADFPSEDLEKYFASLAKKAGGADSRQGTPSRH